MLLERLRIKTFLIKNKDFKACESDWEDCPEYLTLDLLKTRYEEDIKIASKHTPSVNLTEYPWEDVANRLMAGKTASDTLYIYRTKTSDPKCPNCGSSYQKGLHALSRRDNKTRICSDCGVVEAFQDFKRHSQSEESNS